MTTNVIKKYNSARLFILNDASIIQRFSISILFAMLLALTSQIKIYLFFTPVPINLATLVICASSLTLGGLWAFISVIIFIMSGVIGLPVTATSNIIGATTGYLVGYAICALVLGKYSETKKNNFIKTSIVLFIAQITIIHICGMIGLYIWSIHSNYNYSLIDVFLKGSFPFLIGDSLKAIITSYIMTKVIKE